MSEDLVLRRQGDDARLCRIEEKIDILFHEHTKCEQQMHSVFKRNDRFEKRLDDQEDGWRKLNDTVISNSLSAKAGERLFWLAIATAASVLGYLIR